LFTILIVSGFAALMIRGAISDIRHYILSNRLCLMVAGLYPLYLIGLEWEYGGVEGAQILWSIVLAAVLFGIGAGLFAMNVMGGGDVKLIPAVVLWAGPSLILDFLVIMSVTGGIIAAVLLAKKHLNRSKFFKSSENVNVPVAQLEQVNMPYGVGIALGGLYVAAQLIAKLNGAFL